MLLSQFIYFKMSSMQLVYQDDDPTFCDILFPSQKWVVLGTVVHECVQLIMFTERYSGGSSYCKSNIKINGPPNCHLFW